MNATLTNKGLQITLDGFSKEIIIEKDFAQFIVDSIKARQYNDIAIYCYITKQDFYSTDIQSLADCLQHINCTKIVNNQALVNNDWTPIQILWTIRDQPNQIIREISPEELDLLNKRI